MPQRFRWRYRALQALRTLFLGVSMGLVAAYYTGGFSWTDVQSGQFFLAMRANLDPRSPGEEALLHERRASGDFPRLLRALVAYRLQNPSGHTEWQVGAEWQARLSQPFYRDTVFVLVGGPPARVAEWPANQDSLFHGQMEVWHRGGRITLHPAAPQGTLDHELGHLFDLRGIAPSLTRQVYARFHELRNQAPDAYAATNPREHFASAFAQALLCVRRTQQAPHLFLPLLRRSEQILPGTERIVAYLLQHPLYADHAAQQWRSTHAGALSSSSPSTGS